MVRVNTDQIIEQLGGEPELALVAAKIKSILVGIVKEDRVTLDAYTQLSRWCESAGLSVTPEDLIKKAERWL